LETMPATHDDAKYLALIQGALEVCKTYKPMFGMGRKGGMTRVDELPADDEAA